MRFYRNGISIWTIMIIIVICDFVFLLSAFLWRDSDNWYILVPSALISIIWPFGHEMIYVNEHGITCKRRRKIVFSCNWEDIQQFERRHHYQTLCVDIVPIENARSFFSDGYIFTTYAPNFYFELTPYSKKIIRQFCPRAELITQMEKSRKNR